MKTNNPVAMARLNGLVGKKVTLLTTGGEINGCLRSTNGGFGVEVECLPYPDGVMVYFVDIDAIVAIGSHVPNPR